MTVALASGIRKVLKIIMVVKRMDKRSADKQLEKLSNCNTESSLNDHRICQSLNRVFCKDGTCDFFPSRVGMPNHFVKVMWPLSNISMLFSNKLIRDTFRIL